jgi:demethylmenaquinone methyltransferase/2-methoxy-6-polyprenyl-1,4-benzoquinol methylase
VNLLRLKSALSEGLLKTWAWFYHALLDLIFYLPLGGENRFRKNCVDFAGPDNGEKILDVCCGTGSLTYMISQRVGSGGQVIGVDLCKPVLEVTRTGKRYLPVAFLRANAEHLPFAPSSFDKCFLSMGLHHMPEQARQQTLREIYRVLKSTGKLFVVEYYLPDGVLSRLIARVLARIDTSKEAYSMLVKHSLLSEIEQAGFEIGRRGLVYKGAIQLVEAGK